MAGLAFFSSSAGRGHPPAWLSSLRRRRAVALASEPMKVFIGSLVRMNDGRKAARGDALADR